MTKKQYRKIERAVITAVQMDLDCAGFTYKKWNNVQKCQQGDWVVNNNGDCYTIRADVFAKTYEFVSKGQYRKTAIVWAEQTNTERSIETNNGAVQCQAGDYIVSNVGFQDDSYVVSKEKFEAMYKLHEKENC